MAAQAAGEGKICLSYSGHEAGGLQELSGVEDARRGNRVQGVWVKVARQLLGIFRANEASD
jgi:hypothetical protein